jgi:hypothetical protein
MQDPVVDVEGDPFGGEIAAVEDEEVFILVFEALDGVWFALGEVPDVAGGGVEDLVAALVVHYCYLSKG